MPHRTSHQMATLLSALMALPFMIIFTLLVLNIEPNFGPLTPLLTNQDPDQPHIIGTLIVVGFFVLTIVACSINIRVLLRTRRAGLSLTTRPANLMLTLITFGFIALFISLIVIDQYPCWVGVPNCD